jgi:hypothetical protein
MRWRTLIQYWTKIDRFLFDRTTQNGYNIITFKQTEVAMSNDITIKLSDKAIVQIIKILSESTTPTGMPINPMHLLGALGGMPPRPKLEEVEEDKPTIGFKASK